MKILAPLGNPDAPSIARRAQAGADELYFGFHLDAWTEAFGQHRNLNRMSDFGARANALAFQDVGRAIEAIRSHGCTASIALNAPFYEPDQTALLNLICKNLAHLPCGKPDGVIVSSRAVGAIAAKYGLAAAASTMCEACNADIVRAYRDAGFKRIIFPRDTTLEEMGAIVGAFPSMEFEAFIMRDGCMFSDSHCLARHMPAHGALCGALRGCERRMRFAEGADDFRTVHDAELLDGIYRRFFRSFACGLCALYRMVQMGVSSVKVVGRADEEASLIDDIALVSRNRDIALKAASEADYLKSMVFPRGRRSVCKMGLSCYYPEVRFPKDGSAADPQAAS